MSNQIAPARGNTASTPLLSTPPPNHNNYNWWANLSPGLSPVEYNSRVISRGISSVKIQKIVRGFVARKQIQRETTVQKNSCFVFLVVRGFVKLLLSS